MFYAIKYHVCMGNAKSTIQASKRPLKAAGVSATAAKAKSAAPAAHEAKVFQVLVRMPEDMAKRFVQVVKPGQRNSYLLELLRRDLDRESNELAQAAQSLTALEAKDKGLHKEDAAWLNAALLKRDAKTGDGEDHDASFDATEFERQYQVAKRKREATTVTDTNVGRDKAHTPSRRRKPLRAA
jgi:hypothetical protein